MFKFVLQKLLPFSLATLFAIASAAKLQEVSNFGENKTSAKMFLLVPDNLPANPALVVGVHWCHGTAQAFYAGTKYKTLAEQYGFIVIYPNASAEDGCWDVHSKQTLKHDGGGESTAIANMTKYVIEKYNVDPAKVFVTGISSGAMMTNVLLATYPDLFRAGSIFAGVPYACFEGSAAWNTECANGKIEKSGKFWGDKVRKAFPEFDGVRPRVQIWHGSMDFTLRFKNFDEEVKQWTNVLGLSTAPTTTENDVFQEGWTRTRFTDANGVVQVEGIWELGQEHNLVVMEKEALKFFGFDIQ